LIEFPGFIFQPEPGGISPRADPPVQPGGDVLLPAAAAGPYLPPQEQSGDQIHGLPCVKQVFLLDIVYMTTISLHYFEFVQI